MDNGSHVIIILYVHNKLHDVNLIPDLVSLSRYKDTCLLYYGFSKKHRGPNTQA